MYINGGVSGMKDLNVPTYVSDIFLYRVILLQYGSYLKLSLLCGVL